MSADMKKVWRVSDMHHELFEKRVSILLMFVYDGEDYAVVADLGSDLPKLVQAKYLSEIER